MPPARRSRSRCRCARMRRHLWTGSFAVRGTPLARHVGEVVLEVVYDYGGVEPGRRDPAAYVQPDDDPPARFTAHRREELVAGSLFVHVGIDVVRAGDYVIRRQRLRRRGPPHRVPALEGRRCRRAPARSRSRSTAASPTSSTPRRRSRSPTCAGIASCSAMAPDRELMADAAGAVYHSRLSTATSSDEGRVLGSGQASAGRAAAGGRAPRHQDDPANHASARRSTPAGSRRCSVAHSRRHVRCGAALVPVPRRGAGLVSAPEATVQRRPSDPRTAAIGAGVMTRLAWRYAAVVLVAACGAVDGSPPDAAPSDAAPGVEVCTPSTAGAVPRDDNGDGAIDEGCAWHVGSPHALEPTAGAPGTESVDRGQLDQPRRPAPVPGRDHRRRRAVPHRGRLAQRPRPAVRRSGAAGGAALGNYSVGGFTLSSDELEATSSRRPRAGRRQQGHLPDDRAPRRPASSARSSASPSCRPTPTTSARTCARRRDAVSPAAAVLPGASARGRAVRRRRAARGLPDGDVNAPSLVVDGRTIVYYHRSRQRTVPHVPRRARATRRQRTFGDPVEHRLAEPSGPRPAVHPVLSEATRELFYSDQQPPGAPSHDAVWRDPDLPRRWVRARTDPCAGVRGPDGLHCYTKLASTQSWSAAETLCTQNGSAHLATISSQAEQDRCGAASAARACGSACLPTTAARFAECNSAASAAPVLPCAFGWRGEAWTFSPRFSSGGR